MTWLSLGAEDRSADRESAYPGDNPIGVGLYETARANAPTSAAPARAPAKTGLGGSRCTGEDQNHRGEPKLSRSRSGPRFSGARRHARGPLAARLSKAANAARRARCRAYDRGVWQHENP